MQKKKLHTEFPKKKNEKKYEIISRNSLHGQNVWDKKNVPLSDDNVKGKKEPFWGYSRRWLLFDKVATF